MGAAISESITIPSAPQSYHRMFPLHGLGLSHVGEFIEAYGGRQAFEGWSSEDVCVKIVKPLTERLQCSYVDLLRAIKHPACREGKKADVFVSHAWKCNFLVVVDSLLHHFADRLDTIVVWFDVFTINQHTWKEWWSLESINEGIKDIGNTVMVLTSWQDPVPFTRAWCLFELYCTDNKEGCNFEMVMGMKEREDFVATIHAGDERKVVNSVLAKIDVAKSEAGQEQDKKAIHKVMKSVGFSQLSSTVKSFMRNLLIEVAKKEYDRRADTLGKRHHDTLISMAKLGVLYNLQGAHKEAEMLVKECLEINRADLGVMQPDTLMSMHNLASLYDKQKKYGEAEPLYRLVLGDGHPDTFTSMINLALLYDKQKKYGEAESLYVECLEINRAVLGDMHPDILMSMHNLAVLYVNQERYGEAELLRKDCLENQRIALGERHPHTLSSVKSLAMLYKQLGRYGEAVTVYKECLEMQRAVLGDRHPDTLTSRNNLAELYVTKGGYGEAEPLYKECLEINRAILGNRHTDTLSSIINLSEFYKKLERYDEAESLDKECIEIQKKILGERHPDTLTSMNKLASLYEEQGRYDEAEPLYKDCLEIRKAMLGNWHPDTMPSMNKLISLYKKQGKHAEADLLYKDFLEIQKASPGDKHLDKTLSRKESNRQERIERRDFYRFVFTCPFGYFSIDIIRQRNTEEKSLKG
eukprot:CAMPEP_0170131710 /NCGR_PEP_ID=MMETSP0020_2-20130122/23428_1 /TAXON_ID=98059 /ORGANISM="Dinobryon sp., Strain UTEXLB2267" /LENGTH=695 /DNA_ID=CAMNT_0010366873 /DNA_START=888 /DNA_END=2975 /DNA_ORIENTATION=+